MEGLSIQASFLILTIAIKSILSFWQEVIGTQRLGEWPAISEASKNSGYHLFLSRSMCFFLLLFPIVFSTSISNYLIAS